MNKPKGPYPYIANPMSKAIPDSIEDAVKEIKALRRQQIALMTMLDKTEKTAAAWKRLLMLMFPMAEEYMAYCMQSEELDTRLPDPDEIDGMFNSTPLDRITDS